MSYDLVGAITGSAALIGVVATSIVRVLKVGADRESEWRGLIGSAMDDQRRSIQALAKQAEECEARGAVLMHEIRSQASEMHRQSLQISRLEAMVNHSSGVTPTEDIYRAVIGGPP